MIKIDTSIQLYSQADVNIEPWFSAEPQGKYMSIIFA